MLTSAPNKSETSNLMGILLLTLLVAACGSFCLGWPKAVVECAVRHPNGRMVFCVVVVGLSIACFETNIGRPARDLVVDSAVRRALAEREASRTRTPSPAEASLGATGSGPRTPSR